MSSYFRAFLAGVLIWTGFAPLEFWPGPIIGLAIFFSVLVDKRLINRLVISGVVGLTCFLPMLHWSSTYVGALPWLILASGQSLIFALVGLLPVKKSIDGILIFTASFVLLELLRMKAPFGGFGWGRVGFTQVDSLTNLYPFLGVAGISILVAFFAAFFVVNRKSVIVFIALLLSGLIPITNANITDDSFNIIAVQGGVDELGFSFNDNPMRVLERHIEATPIKHNADLILWPENSVDVDPAKSSTSANKMKQYFNRSSTYLLAGVVEQTAKGPQNSSVLYNSKGVISQRYVKQDLAPFGEFMPLRSLAEKVSSYASQVNDFQPGDRFTPFEIDGWNMQSFICFEILDDDHVRLGAQNMDFLIAQTNNATFGTSSQAAQQLQITRARAAELNKEIAVVSTTGFTAHLDKNGEILQKLKQFEPAALEMQMQGSRGQSWASKVSSGEWLVLTLLMLILSVFRRYRYSR